MTAETAAWSRVDQITESPKTHLPEVAVAYSRLRVWREDGSADFEPILAYSESQLDDAMERQRVDRTSIFGKFAAKQIEELESFFAEKKAELRRLLDERMAAEEACGLVDATAVANEATAVAAFRLKAIIDRPYSTVSEVQEAAAYLVNCERDGAEGIDADTLANFARRLAGETCA